jgi:hypothetical protein
MATDGKVNWTRSARPARRNSSSSHGTATRQSRLASHSAHASTLGHQRIRAALVTAIPLALPSSPRHRHPTLVGHAPVWPIPVSQALRTPVRRPSHAKRPARPCSVAPLGGVERPRRKERFARLTHRRVRAFWPTFRRRRLRRQSEPVLAATHGGAP